MIPPRWFRRLVLAPAIVLAALLLVPTSLMLVLLVVGIVTWAWPGRLRTPRVLWMASFYVLWDAAAVLALFGLWIATGCGWAMQRRWAQRAHYRLAAGMIGIFFWQVRWTLRLRIEHESDAGPDVRGEARPPAQRPAIVVSRHAGPGDSFVIVDAMLNLFGREPRIVLKDTLQWDPAIDTLLHRIPTQFVAPRSRRRADAPGGSAAVGALAHGMGPRGAVLLFPEGGNVTPGRRARRIEALRAAGSDELADQAEAMPHVMAPHIGGFLAAVEEAPEADVVVVAHTGLEKLVTPRDIWRELPMDKRIVTRRWVTRAADLPRDPAARETWLYDQWRQVDAWITEQAATRD
ncbi:acyltransferase-like protein [Sediminihabitans luteus]|uniref:Acyltransferase-like protein n=1 Tax=Sediminihabitans luteus TaxID=1138585 RepID=A0A2M9CDK9_9CELL|nr:1-acyl-sn-glycerol-3-phosphate acyltransferase [Sediminihabitans luteus]PJJ69955.1 acyltransferase-like protein [Sediminihabitans luteus]GII99275.1 hypothetical protein Slu03_16530 [Sediminihabitans luteus]